MTKTVTPGSCPVCSSNNIGVKDHTVQTPWHTVAVTTWAYCRQCEHKGPEAVCSYEDSEEIDIAFRAWNNQIFLHKEKLGAGA